MIISKSVISSGEKYLKEEMYEMYQTYCIYGIACAIK